MAAKTKASAKAGPAKPKAKPTKATTTSATSSKRAAVPKKSGAAGRSRSATPKVKTSSKSSVASRTKPVKAKPAPASVKTTAKAAASTSAKKASQNLKKSVSKSAAKPAAPKKSAAPAKAGTKAKSAPVKAKAAAGQAAAKTAKKPPLTKAAASKAATATKKPVAAKPAKASAARKAKAPKATFAKPVPAANAAVATGAAARAVAASIAEAAQRKISSPITPLKTPKAVAQKSAFNVDASQQKKSVSQRHGFKTSEHVVYPAHGVGRIIGIEEQEIAGMALELFVINFEKEKLTLRVPTGKLESVGLRKLAEDKVVAKALDVLKGRARVKRTMWSRRAQEYDAKINSGDLIALAEVVRDLYRSEAQPEQSYSERQLYEAALDRMAREVAVVYKLDERGAIQTITDVLSKSARTRRAAENAAESDGEPSQAA